MTLNFNAKKRRGFRTTGGAFRNIDHLNGVQGFGIHPMDTPSARMNWHLLARSITNGAIRAMISNVRCSSAGIPIQEKAGPTMMMHRLSLTGGRHSDFEHAHEGVFEYDSVAIRRGLHSVVAIGELGFVLSVEVETTGEQRKKTRNENREKS